MGDVVMDQGVGGDESVANSEKLTEDGDVVSGRRKEGGEEEPVKKKVKVDYGSSGDIFKRVAEIVLILSSIGEMRGGRSPTEFERGLMMEAREKLAEICESFAPKDLFSRDSIRVMIEDLGLNRTREQKLGFHPPRMSISEKLLLTKRKMEESKNFVSQPATYSSQMLQVGHGQNVETKSAVFHATQRFMSDRQSPSSMSSVGLQSSPIGHSLGSPASPLNNTHSSQVQSVTSRNLPSSGVLESGFSKSTLIQRETEHDVKSNGPSNVLQAQANSLSNQLPVKTMQSAHVSVIKGTQEDQVVSGASSVVKSNQEKNASQKVAQMTNDPNFKPSPVQSLSRNLQVGRNHMQSPSLNSNHNEISRNIQKILQPKPLNHHPNWIPPSTEYMNRPLVCLVCKATINDVESLLVCDSCEKGVHLKCLQTYNVKGIPKGEWHCPKCLLSSKGKPLPPKYGRVTRNVNAQAQTVSANSSGVQTADKKTERVEQNISHPKITANGNHPSNVPPRDSNDAASVENPRSKQSDTEDKDSHKEAHLDESREDTSRICAQADASKGTSNETDQLNLSETDSTKQASELNSIQCAGSEASCVPHTINDPETHNLITSNDLHDVDSSHLLINSKECANQSQQENNCEFDVPEMPPNVIGIADSRPGSALPEKDDAIMQNLASGNKEVESSSFSNVLNQVEWIGDAVKVVDEKAYYQACNIKGVKYNLQDNILLQSFKHSSTPSKLQELWEDQKTMEKWAMVRQFYFPKDLPKFEVQTEIPKENEVSFTVLVNFYLLIDIKKKVTGGNNLNQRRNFPWSQFSYAGGFMMNQKMFCSLTPIDTTKPFFRYLMATNCPIKCEQTSKDGTTHEKGKGFLKPVKYNLQTQCPSL